MKVLAFIFVAYNLFLASALIGPLTTPGPSTQTTTSFSDEDFGQPTQPPPRIRVSKPFYESAGLILSFNFEQYGTSNVTGLTIDSFECGTCNMVIVPLPLAPLPTPAKDGTILGDVSTYNVKQFL
jgi:hypothetical protein